MTIKNAHIFNLLCESSARGAGPFRPLAQVRRCFSSGRIRTVTASSSAGQSFPDANAANSKKWRFRIWRCGVRSRFPVGGVDAIAAARRATNGTLRDHLYESDNARRPMADEYADDAPFIRCVGSGLHHERPGHRRSRTYLSHPLLAGLAASVVGCTIRRRLLDRAG
jgi:hypothetical protein